MYTFAYNVPFDKLPGALQMMNRGSDWFKTRVVSATPMEKHVLVIVSHTNDYPFITNEWEKYLKGEA